MHALFIRNVIVSVLFLLAILALETSNLSAPAWAADATVTIDNFTFAPQQPNSEGRHHDHLGEPRRYPSCARVEYQGLQIEGARHRRQILVHVRDTWRLRLLLLDASSYDGHDCGRVREGERDGSVSTDVGH